jgi:TonB family protein
VKFIVYLLMLVCLTHSALGADEICAKHVVIPEYPRIPLTAGIQAAMSVEITISTVGNVLNANATGHPLFKSAAEETVKKWTFSKADPASGLRIMKITFDYAIADSGETGVTLDLPDHVVVRVLPPHVQPNSAATQN